MSLCGALGQPREIIEELRRKDVRGGIIALSIVVRRGLLSAMWVVRHWRCPPWGGSAGRKVRSDVAWVARPILLDD
jgi:hypothetical protein